MNAVVAALEHRMDEHDRAKFVGGFPERRQRGIVEHAAFAFGLGADHGALEAGGMRLAQHFGGARAVLQRHGGERHEARLAHRGLRQMGVDQPRPGRALLRRHFVGEHVEPAADHLTLDLLLVHPFQAGRQIAQRL